MSINTKIRHLFLFWIVTLFWFFFLQDPNFCNYQTTFFSKWNQDKFKNEFYVTKSGLLVRNFTKNISAIDRNSLTKREDYKISWSELLSAKTEEEVSDKLLKIIKSYGVDVYKNDILI